MNEVTWWKKFPLLGEVLRPVPETELKNRAAAPAHKTVFEILFGPPSCLTTLYYLWWPSEAVRGCWGWSVFGSQQTSKTESSGSSSIRSRTVVDVERVRGRGRLRREIRNLKQLLKQLTNVEAGQNIQQIFKHNWTSKGRKFYTNEIVKMIISNDFKNILCWLASLIEERIKLPGI